MTEPRDLGRQWKIKDRCQGLSMAAEDCHSVFRALIPFYETKNAKHNVHLMKIKYQRNLM